MLANTGKRFKFSLFFFLSLISCFASAATKVCSEVIIGADLHWPPYALTQGDEISGAGVILAKKIFSELDVPVKVVSAMQSDHDTPFKFNDIDLHVNIYNYPEADKVLSIVQPGYMDDPITAVVSLKKTILPNTWDDLVGQRGRATQYFELDKHFHRFADRYLYLQFFGDLVQGAEAVSQQKADYLIGSHYQLQYLTKQLVTNKNLLLVTNLTRNAKVHMAFIQDSPCKIYQPYVAQRLQDFSHAGKAKQIAQKIIAGDAVGASKLVENN